MVTSTLFSELFPGLHFLKNNQLKIILTSKETAYSSTFRMHPKKKLFFSPGLCLSWNWTLLNYFLNFIFQLIIMHIVEMWLIFLKIDLILCILTKLVLIYFICWIHRIFCVCKQSSESHESCTWFLNLQLNNYKADT